jgi:hypothetical protein
MPVPIDKIKRQIARKGIKKVFGKTKASKRKIQAQDLEGAGQRVSDEGESQRAGQSDHGGEEEAPHRDVGGDQGSQ